jgi:hypothetical protein
VDETAIAESQTTIRFTLMNDSAGVHHTYQNGSEHKKRRILESVGGGGGMFDYDCDGLLDLSFAGGGYYGEKKSLHGHPAALFRSLGDWKFVEVSAAAGGGFPAAHYSHGTQAADFDNDGFLDFIICGYGGLQLWHNLGMEPLKRSTRSRAAGQAVEHVRRLGDLNEDGFVDLYVAHYADWSLDNDPNCPAPVPGERETCPPKEFKSLPDTLYFSNGDGTFRDVSRQAGIRLDPIRAADGRPQELGKGLGVLINDFDLDGDEDIYVANDTVDNFLYLNEGDGTFVEDGVLRGVATDDVGMPNGSMGVDVGDFNRDGLPDIWVANYQHEANALYRNDGAGSSRTSAVRWGSPPWGAYSWDLEPYSPISTATGSTTLSLPTGTCSFSRPTRRSDRSRSSS